MTLASKADGQVHPRYHSMAASLGANITNESLIKTKDKGIAVPLVNVLNSQYMGRIYVGQPASQSALVVVDSGSNWLTVMAYGKEKAYSPQKSDTARFIGSNEPQTYGSATLSGSLFKDTVCMSDLGGKSKPQEEDLANADCVSDFQFIAVTESRGLNAGIQGILGLGPFNQKSPSLFSEMLRKNMVDKPIVSFSLGSNSKTAKNSAESYMILGGINETQYVGQLQDFKISTNQWWAPSLNGFHYSDEVIVQFADNTAFAVIDTGTSMLALPKVYLNLLINMWKRDLPDNVPFDCSLGVCIAATHCDRVKKTIGSVTFQIGNKMLEMKPESYLIDAADLDPTYAGSCIMGVIVTPEVADL